jgi:hypothetical protein
VSFVDIVVQIHRAMSKFGKNEDCPPSQQLLAFQTGNIDKVEARQLRRHLERCEFCAAEVEFYGHYPQADEGSKPEAGAMPKPLYDLAEALLVRKAARRLFDDLVNEIDGGPSVRP